MNSTWEKVLAAMGIAFGVTLGISISVTLTVLFISGWRTESEKTTTEFSFRTGVDFKRQTQKELKEGGGSSQSNSSGETPDKQSDKSGSSNEEMGSKGGGRNASKNAYVGGTWVSGKSTMRYSMSDSQGQVNVSGYDVMRGQNVFCGSGRMAGRRLIVPNFYSFLDSTRGTLTLDLSEDGKTLEGYFTGNNPTQEARVILVRLP